MREKKRRNTSITNTLSYRHIKRVTDIHTFLNRKYDTYIKYTRDTSTARQDGPQLETCYFLKEGEKRKNAEPTRLGAVVST